MKKSTKKTINRLSNYIGLKIVRTKPTLTGDWSYTDDAPILLTGFTSTGQIKYRHTGRELLVFGNKEFTLPSEFTDRNWITYKSALRAKHNTLNKWKGKKIRRIHPRYRGYYVDRSFMDEEFPTLISASKHHMVLQYNDPVLKGEIFLLASDYANPEDWVLVE